MEPAVRCPAPLPALGYDMISAVERAKAFISGALRDGLDLGQGSGPLNHCWNIKQKQPL